MSGSNYYTKFVFTSSGLSAILSEFKSAAAQINAQSAALGKVNFAGLNSAIPILTRIEAEIRAVGASLNAVSAQGAKAGASLNPLAAGATKAAASVKTVGSSMSQLASVSGTVSSATSRVTSSLTAMGAAGKSAFSGIISGSERAIASMSALSAATMSVGRSMARMGTLAAIPMAGMRGLSGAITGSLLASSAAMLLNPLNAAPLAAGYGVYTHGNVGKAAAEAAAKSWQPGMTQKDIDAIKQAVTSSSRASAGQSVYSPTDIAKMWAEYAGMGGDVSAGKITDSLSKVFTNYAQAINAPDIGTALNTLVSQNLVWSGQDKAFNEATLRRTSDMMSMVVAQTKLKGENLNDLLKDVSPVAKAYGMSQEETYAMTGGLAQLGLNPQQAGMALRRILLRGTPNVNDLQKQAAYNEGITNEKGQIIDESTGKAISLSNVNKALEQLDVTWEQINPEKNINGVVGVFQDIAGKMKKMGMTPEQQQAWMKTVYGLQGVTPAAMLTQNPEYLLDLFNKIKKSSEGAGASSFMSGIMTDNMIDRFKMLGSAVKGSADAIGEYLEPGVVKLTNFLKDTAVPQLNALGSAVAAGDWKGVADIVGGAVDFIGEKFFASGEGITEFINGAIDGLDEFAGRLATFATGGGVGGLLGGLGDWAKSIWDNIDWGQVDNIVSNLSTAFNIAWDQSMAWLQTKIDAINWDSVGTKAGQALEKVGAWILKGAQAIPWASVASACANAIFGAIAGINWQAAFAGAVSAAGSIGAAIASGIANSGIGTTLQNAAIGFRNSIMSAVGDIRASAVDLAMTAGISPNDILGFSAATDAEGNALLKGGGSLLSAITNNGSLGAYNKLNPNNQAAEGTADVGVAWDRTKNTLGNLFIPGKVADGSLLDTIAGAAKKTWDYLFGESVKYRPRVAAGGGAVNSFGGGGVGPFSYTNPPFFDQVNELHQRELGTYSRFLLEEKLPEWEAGVFECLQIYERNKNNYAKWLLNDQERDNDTFYKDLDLVNAVDSWHFLTGVTPGGNVGDPRDTYLFDAETDSYEGTIANAPNYKSESLMRLSETYKKDPNDIELINTEEGWDFVPNIPTRGTRRNFGKQQGIAQGAGLGQRRYINELIKKASGFFNNFKSPISSLGGGGGSAGENLKAELNNPLSPTNIQAAKDYAAYTGGVGVGGTVDTTGAGVYASPGFATGESEGDSGGGVLDTLLIPEFKKGLDDFANYWNDKSNYFDREGTWLETKIGKKSSAEEVFGTGQTPPLVDATNKATDATNKVTDATSKSKEATSELASVTSNSSSIYQSSSDNVANALNSFTPNIKDLLSREGPLDYKALSEAFQKEYATSMGAEDLRRADARTPDREDLIAKMAQYSLRTPYITPEEKKTADSTSKTANNTSKGATSADIKGLGADIVGALEGIKGSGEKTNDAVQSTKVSAETQAKRDQALQETMISTICEMEFLTLEKLAPLGTFVGTPGGKMVRVADSWMTFAEYEAMTGISLADQQMNAAAKVGKVPFYGTITAEDIPQILADYEKKAPWAQANERQALVKYQSMIEDDLGLPASWGTAKTPYSMALGGESRKPDMSPILLGSLAKGGVMEIPVEPDVNLEPIESLATTAAAGLPYDVKVTSNADSVAAQLAGLGGSTSFTVFVNTVYSSSGGGGGKNYTSMNDIPGVNYTPGGTPYRSINDIPRFAEGGYTGSYGGPATVHPNELILNAAQQRGLSDAIGGGKVYNINIDARGATITDSSMDTLVAKIKSALQDESYR